MSGLLVDSGYNPIKPNYMKPDTDDDGLDDNEEVDVELTKVEVPGKQGNPSTSNMCYEKMIFLDANAFYSYYGRSKLGMTSEPVDEER